MDRIINNKGKCMCVFSKVKKCRDENGNIMLKCRRCKKIIFVADKKVNIKEMIGRTRTGLGRSDKL